MAAESKGGDAEGGRTPLSKPPPSPVEAEAGGVAASSPRTAAVGQSHPSRQPAFSSTGSDIDAGEWADLLPTVQTPDGARIPVPWLWLKRRILLVVLPCLAHPESNAIASAYDELIRPALATEGIPVVMITLANRSGAKRWLSAQEEFGCELYVDDTTTSGTAAVDDGKQHSDVYENFSLTRHSAAERLGKLLAAVDDGSGAAPEVDLAYDGGDDDARADGMVATGLDGVKIDDLKKAVAEQATSAGFSMLDYIGGDLRQLGGVFVLGPGSVCDFAYRARFVGDMPLPGPVLSAAVGRPVESRDGVLVDVPAVRSKAAEAGGDDSDVDDEAVSGSAQPWRGFLAGANGFRFQGVRQWARHLDVFRRRGGVPTGSEFTLRDGGNQDEANLRINGPTMGITGRMPAMTVALLATVMISSHLWLFAFVNPGDDVAGVPSDVVENMSRTVTIASVVLLAMGLVGGKLKWRHDPPPRPTVDEEAVQKARGGPRVQLLRTAEIDELVLRSGVWDACPGPLHPSEPTSSRARSRSRGSTVSSLGSGAGGAAGSDGDCASGGSTAGVALAKPELLQHYRAVVRFCRGWLSRSHAAAAGRVGPICPYVPMADNHSSLYVGVVEPDALGETMPDRVASAVAALRRLADVFHELVPSTGPLLECKAVVLALPGLDPDEAGSLVAHVESACADTLLAQGIVLGGFHPNNDTPGVWSPHSCPMRSPMPMLVLRGVVPADAERLLHYDDSHNGFKQLPAEQKRGILANFVKLYGNDGAAEPENEEVHKLADEARRVLDGL